MRVFCGVQRVNTDRFVKKEPSGSDFGVFLYTFAPGLKARRPPFSASRMARPKGIRELADCLGTISLS